MASERSPSLALCLPDVHAEADRPDDGQACAYGAQRLYVLARLFKNFMDVLERRPSALLILLR